MKNIQIIDSAVNCTYSIYSITDEQFEKIFIGDSDVEFIEDVERRLDKEEFQQLHSSLWERPIEKVNAVGIHGTMFYGLHDLKRRFYPNKKFYDDVYGFSPEQRSVFKIE